MIRWCSYCQQYMGERPPLDDFSLTHGMCDQCSSKLELHEDALYDKAIGLKDYYRKLHEACFHGDWIKVKELILKAHQTTMRPEDLCLGMIQPFLYEVGCLWEKSKVSVADEHKLTSVCSSVIEMFFNMYPQYHHLRQSGTPKVLLANAEDNYHILGIRMVEFMLMAHQIPTCTLFPGLPATEVFNLIQELNPPIVGISVALGIQMKSVRELLGLVKNLEPAVKPKVYVGGQYIRFGLNPQISFEASIVHNVRDFLKEAGNG
jgi:methanogenic corrinoid protein MtbC1